MSGHPSKEEVRLYIRNKVEELNLFCRHEFNFNDAWKIRVTCDFSNRRKTSYGGTTRRSGVMVPYINLSLHYPVNYPIRYFLEYDHYSSHPIIGGYRTTSWKKYINGLITHEVSHAVQYSFKFTKNSKGKSSYMAFYDKKEHGLFFQKIYKTLRIHFVNDQLNQSRIGKK